MMQKTTHIWLVKFSSDSYQYLRSPSENPNEAYKSRKVKLFEIIRTKSLAQLEKKTEITQVTFANPGATCNKDQKSVKSVKKDVRLKNGFGQVQVGSASRRLESFASTKSVLCPHPSPWQSAISPIPPFWVIWLPPIGLIVVRFAVSGARTE